MRLSPVKWHWVVSVVRYSNVASLSVSSESSLMGKIGTCDGMFMSELADAPCAGDRDLDRDTG